MFNLPWFSWLNVLAIPLLWGMMWVGLRIEKSPRWQHHASVVGHLSIVAVIMLYWNPAVAKLFYPSDYLIAMLALGTCLVTLVPLLYECIKLNFRTLQLARNPEIIHEGADSKPVSSMVAAKANPEYVDGILDIDDDPRCGAEALELADAFSAALSPQKSLLDSDLVQRNAKDFSDTDLQEDPAYWNGSMWITFIGYAIALGAPLWMSWQFLTTLPAYLGIN